jgi:RNA polymerase sigma-70 factor (ECF subfamily)
MRNEAWSARADTDLIAALRDGRSEAAFRELHRRHTPRLLRLIMRMLGDAYVDAEDLVQETWMRAVESLAGFRGDAQFGTWLTRIGIRRTQDHQRRAKRAHLRLDETVEPADREPSHAERIDLEEMLARLPDGYRAVLLLHDLEGFTHAEIGEMLGVSAGTSKSQLHAARRLAQALFDGGIPSAECARDGAGPHARRVLDS